jgi:hypothetical protein
MTLMVAICIGITAMAIAIGPFLSMPSYSSIRHTTSELAGQRMPNAWIMRMGLFAYGIGAIALALFRGGSGFIGTAALTVFGLCLIGTAIWAHKPIDPKLTFSAREDRLHSLFASMMGLAFALAVMAELADGTAFARDWLSWGALAASIVFPIGMAIVPSLAGLFQRSIFAVSFAWVLREAGLWP